MKTYHCKVEYDNGATVKLLTMVVFAENEFRASQIIEKHLCKHYCESIRSATINEIRLREGDAFIVGEIF